DWQRRIDPSLLMKYRLAGIVVEEAQAVYEKLFERVCCERLQPMDLLLSSALRGDSRTMAIQAVYTNLIALALLLLLSPVLILISLAVFLFSVKPGILGWASLHAPRHCLADDCRQVEYDLH